MRWYLRRMISLMPDLSDAYPSNTQLQALLVIQSGYSRVSLIQEPGAFIFLINFPMSQPLVPSGKQQCVASDDSCFISVSPSTGLPTGGTVSSPSSTVGGTFPGTFLEQGHSHLPYKPVFLPGPHPLCLGRRASLCPLCPTDNSTRCGAATRAMC